MREFRSTLKTLTSTVAFEAGMSKSRYDAYAFPTRDESRRLGRRPIFCVAQSKDLRDRGKT
jgi:hypothetical protein